MRGPLESADGRKRAEFVLLALFLLGQIWHLYAQNGQISGFDAGDFLFRVSQTARGAANPDLHACFWAYHPPLAFLLARAAQIVFHVSDVRGIQLVSQGAFLLAFFTLRATLQRLELLATSRGTAFLYLACTLPIAVHASASVNMDVLILGYTGAALLCSVCLWERPMANRSARIVLAGLLTLTLTVALFTKFSGLLIGAVPLLTALRQPGTPAARTRRGAVAAGIVLLAVALAAPYYYGRYYRTTGSFCPNVNEWWYPDALRAARARRDADRAAFLGDLFRSRSVASGAPDPSRDMAHARLEDAWRDLWFKDPLLGTTSRLALRIGRADAWAFGIGLLLGAASLLSGARRRNPQEHTWQRLGIILMAYGLLQLGALIGFVYQQPLADCVPGKGLYILPATWSLAFLVASGLPGGSGATRLASALSLALTGAFMLIHLLLPVY